MKLSDHYMSGREVQKLLGITEPKLRTLVSNNTLTKIVPPGRKTGLYIKSEVYNYAERWEAFLLAKEPPKASFAIAKVEDMPAEYELAKRVLGATMAIEQRQAWIKKNPECDFIVKYNDRVVAYLTLLPLKHQVIENFMQGKIRGWEIQEEDIETYEPGKQLECIIMGTASDPDMGEEAKKGYMLILIRGLMRFLEELGERGIYINKVYSTSETPTGIAMSLHLGMEELKPRLGKRLRFVLDVQQSDHFLFKSYKESLARWENAQKVEIK
ncbi:hypothetical protein KDW_22230 [Dictyobacter vulcani]|uniref:Uncharacterized protein n=1 Tax=Dictyobacter vulcani TaxID=2607529 RepID=A0A5J4KNY9_9CHLR|nr:hypothetical protein [Dictyobacter vulcani]GER88061.1 hypothetical protein KDW_22230 [Dictyobacter vulcani]